MKKKIIILAVFLLPLFSVSQPYYDGISSFSAGLGVGNTFYDGKGYNIVGPGVSLAYDYGVKYIKMGADVDGLIGIGALLGWASAKYEYPTWGGDLWINYNSIALGVRGNYFFLFSDKFVPYGGLQATYNISLHSWGGEALPPREYDYRDSAMEFGGVAGFRYYFNESVALFAEGGWGINIFTLGATFNIY